MPPEQAGVQTLEKQAQVSRHLALLDFKEHSLRREGMYSCRVSVDFRAF